MIMKGQVNFSHVNGTIGSFKSGDYFGAESLVVLGDRMQAQVNSAIQIVAVTDVEAAELTADSVRRAIGDMGRLGKPLPPRADSLDASIKFTDLEKLNILGMGTFGRVWLVKDTKTKKTYALKVLEKAKIIKHGQSKGVIREKNIMASISHPLIVNLVNHYKDKDYLYMLIELCLGGELFSVLHTATQDGCSVNDAKFYSSCILVR